MLVIICNNIVRLPGKDLAGILRALDSLTTLATVILTQLLLISVCVCVCVCVCDALVFLL